MKALTVHQPYAWLIMAGHKSVENRSQRFNHRGPIAIHAGARAGAEYHAHLGTIDHWRRHGFDVPEVEDLAFRAVIAIADLVDCIDYDRCLKAPPICVDGHDWLVGRALREDVFATGPFCLILANVRPLKRPIPCSGKQGLWTFDDDLLPESFRAK